MLQSSRLTYIGMFLFAASFLLTLTGCSKNKPLDEQKFIEVYYDILVQQEVKGGEYSVMQQIREEVYKKHNITHEQYQATLTYYSEDTERWEKFYDAMMAYVREREKEVMGSNSNKE